MTVGEWTSISNGLAQALSDVGASPILVDGVHPAARIAALWRGRAPILTRDQIIWWAGVPDELSLPGRERGMATLQHELQHVLDFATGWLTPLRYVAQPRHWTYRWRLSDGVEWAQLGAEQRASVAEQLWMIERGLAPPDDLAALRRLIPWA